MLGGEGGGGVLLRLQSVEASLIFAHSVTPTTQNKPFFNTELQLTPEGRGRRRAGHHIQILRKTKTHDVIPRGTIVG